MNSALEECGTSVHHLARHVRQCLHGQLRSKTMLATALQLLFNCRNVVLCSSLSIRSDYLVAQNKSAEPLRQVGGARYEEYANFC